MLLKIVCQICGRKYLLDTSKPFGSAIHWESYRLEELGVPKNHPFHDYEIWICPKCQELAVEHWSVEYDIDDFERLVAVCIPEISYEILKKLVLNSLGEIEKFGESKEE